MKLVFATQNVNKLTEVDALLGKEFSLISLKDIGCNEDIPETQYTIKGNALQKASYVFEHYRVDCFAEDTGLEVEALGGEPGVFSARYGGEEKNSEANIAKLLSNLLGETNRKAQFRTVIALIIAGKSYLFEGIVKGAITTTKIGDKGFGYDPVFMPEGYNKTFARMELTEKKTLSHRSIAFKKLRRFLQNYSYA